MLVSIRERTAQARAIAVGEGEQVVREPAMTSERQLGKFFVRPSRTSDMEATQQQPNGVQRHCAENELVRCPCDQAAALEGKGKREY